MRRRVYVLVTSPEGEPQIFNWSAIHVPESDPDIEKVIFGDEPSKAMVMQMIIRMIAGMGQHGAPAKPITLYRAADFSDDFNLSDNGVLVQLTMYPVCTFNERNQPVPLKSSSQSQPA